MVWQMGVSFDKSCHFLENGRDSAICRTRFRGRGVKDRSFFSRQGTGGFQNNPSRFRQNQKIYEMVSLSLPGEGFFAAAPKIPASHNTNYVKSGWELSRFRRALLPERLGKDDPNIFIMQ